MMVDVKQQATKEKIQKIPDDGTPYFHPKQLLLQVKQLRTVRDDVPFWAGKQ